MFVLVKLYTFVWKKGFFDRGEHILKHVIVHIRVRVCILIQSIIEVYIINVCTKIFDRVWIVGLFDNEFGFWLHASGKVDTEEAR